MSWCNVGCLFLVKISVSVGCLILQQRHQRRFTRYMDLAQDVSEEASPSSSTEIETNIESNPGTSSDSGISPGKSTKCGALPTINEGCCEDSPVIDIEDLLPADDNQALCPSRFGCQGPKRRQCQGIVKQYQEQIDDDLEYIEEEPESHEPQLLRHTVLLIFLLCSMFVVS